MKLIPEAAFRSTAMDDLCRVRKSPVGGGLVELEWERPGIARSIRITEAPLSARRSPAKGPGHLLEILIGDEGLTYQEQDQRTPRRGFLSMLVVSY
jgi:hypothetical protein